MYAANFNQLNSCQPQVHSAPTAEINSQESRPHAGTRARSRRRKRRGAATVEMAMVAPFVIMMVFGAIEFSRIMMVKQSLTNTAREGCRRAILATTQDSSVAVSHARERMKGIIKNYSDPDVLRITITPEFSEIPTSGSLITTSVEIDCADVSWLPPVFFAGAVIRGSSTMNRE